MMLTLNDVAEDLRITRRTLYRWIEQGKFKVAVKIDGIWRVDEEDFRRFKEEARAGIWVEK